mmetsp:Transcript_15611/g.28217  ORF Transcript_15611/g.28217 Transcript_15611/m.28217 type:complete len:89 (+) Transcript_15611:63-329(+)
MSAIFDFSSLITVLLLLICTCTYLRELRPAIFDPAMTPEQQQQQQRKPHEGRHGIAGFCWKLSRIGERLSPYIGASCALMAIHILFLK